jgi:hypothetical protein
MSSPLEMACGKKAANFAPRKRRDSKIVPGRAKCLQDPQIAEHGS